MQTPKITNIDTKTNFNGTFNSFYKTLSKPTQKYVDEAKPALEKMIKEEPFDLYLFEHNRNGNTIIQFLARNPKKFNNENYTSAYTTNKGHEVAKLYKTAAQHAITDYKKQFLHKDNWVKRQISQVLDYILRG